MSGETTHLYDQTDIVGDKAKEGNLKTEVTRKNEPNSAKNEHFLPSDTHTYLCVSQGAKCSFFGNLACFVFLFPPL